MPDSMADQLAALRGTLKVDPPRIQVVPMKTTTSPETDVPTLSDQDNLAPLEPPMPGDRTFSAIEPIGGYVRVFKNRRREEAKTEKEEPKKVQATMNIPLVGGGHMEVTPSEEQQLEIYRINLRNQRDQRILTLSMAALSVVGTVATALGIIFGIKAETKKAP